MAAVLAESQQEIDAFMRGAIGRVATGPEYSKDLSFEESRAVMNYILRDVADPIQAGVYLIALRMKRETDDENGGSLQAILDQTERVIADVDAVVDIAEPYDGYMRGAPVMAFLPALLSACGLPALSHGLEEVGPKFGVTHRKVLREAGINVDLTPSQAVDRINNKDIGWSYIDQASFCKPLHDLVPLRKRIIKRPVLTTVEVLAKPISGKKSTHLMTGYVHKPYPPVYERLAKLAGYESAVLVRGVEGGVTPALNKPAKYFQYHGLQGELIEVDLVPSDLGIEQSKRCVPIPEHITQTDVNGEDIVDVGALSKVSAQAGLEALDGKGGPAKDCLTYSAAIMLQHLGKAESLKQGAEMVSDVIAAGKAMSCFQTS
ncbi:MAG: anthranilate phosphoribosyltransferase [Gammaproteobacteria bacterium]|nr:anthranilate phosphoribosyltransferase [Gammaproteobacteria bacterium]